MAETDALLGASKTGQASRRIKPQGPTGCCAVLCCKSGPLSYSDISTEADEAVDALVTELTQEPVVDASGGGIFGGRDPRVVDALQRMWSAVAVEAGDSFSTAPPKIPHREWKRLGFQVRRRTCPRGVGQGARSVGWLQRQCASNASGSSARRGRRCRAVV